jgi:hypothetical protein
MSTEIIWPTQANIYIYDCVLNYCRMQRSQVLAQLQQWEWYLKLEV